MLSSCRARFSGTHEARGSMPVREMEHSREVSEFFFQGRAHIFKIHARSMSVERDIRYELLARLCPNTTGQSHFNVVVSLRHKLWVDSKLH